MDRLRQDGHAVRYIVEMEPGISDDGVLDLANQEADALLTADKDFGELVFRQDRLTLVFPDSPVGVMRNYGAVMRICFQRIRATLASQSER